MQGTTHYFVKQFFKNRSKIFTALPKFYARHLGVKITSPYYEHLLRRRAPHTLYSIIIRA
jgi:hypothetical protein